MFYSVLFPDEASMQARRRTDAPEYFYDLHLDTIVSRVLSGRERDGLEQFFYTTVQDAAVIRFRQEIMLDLMDAGVMLRVRRFADGMRRVFASIGALRRELQDPKSRHYNNLTRGRLLSFAEQYAKAVRLAAEEIDPQGFQSEGLRSFFSYVAEQACSEEMAALEKDIVGVREMLSRVEYNMLITDSAIRVRKYAGEEDYSKIILAAFAKFKQQDAEDYRHDFPEEPLADHVEAKILYMLQKDFPDEIAALQDFCSAHLYFAQERMEAFCTEIQFYLAWLEFEGSYREAGLSFCIPRIAEGEQQMYCEEGYDLALAARLLPEKPVCNGFSLTPPEKALVVTGPNQGGKTTYARSIGQMHHLASIGCAVPARSAALRLVDAVYVHFEREETAASEDGKLQEELFRLRGVLDKATGQSLVVLNEMFTSATLLDALLFSQRILDTLIGRGALVVCVTFLDELSQRGEETVSMMSLVDEENPTKRTYKILRKEADGLAYAMHIAQKHAMTYEQLRGRLMA